MLNDLPSTAELIYENLKDTNAWKLIQLIGHARTNILDYKDLLHTKSYINIRDFLVLLDRDLERIQRSIISPNHDTQWMNDAPEILELLKTAPNRG